MFRLFILLASLSLVQPVSAQQIEGALGRFERGDVVVERLGWQLTRTQQGWAGDVSAGQAMVGSADSVRDISLSCAQLSFDKQQIDCNNGTLAADITQWPERLEAELSELLVEFDPLLVAASGELVWQQQPFQIDLRWQDGVVSWAGELRPSDLTQIDVVKRLAKRADLSLGGGELGVLFTGEYGAGQPLSLSVDYVINGLGFDNSEGTIAGADLSLSGNIVLTSNDAGLQLASSNSRLVAGEALLGPLYLAVSDDSALSMSWSAQWDRETSLAVDAFAVSDGSSLELNGAAKLNWTEGFALDWLQVTQGAMTFPLANERYLASVADSLGWGEVELGGALEFAGDWSSAGLTRLVMQPDKLSVAAPNSRLQLTELDGIINYQLASHPNPSRVSWQRASYYDLAFGPTEIGFHSQARGFELLEPLKLGLFDGSVNIDQLIVNNADPQQPQFDFRGGITPVSLKPITEALGWPSLQGTISGEIPQVSLRDDVVKLDGAVQLDLFDGVVALDNLTLERVFGVLPTLAADVSIDNIDLEQMTGAFSFGKIEGRMDGTVAGLRLLNWQPVAFDLDLHTPADDRSRHRLSQRAVDNLANIGGGSSAGLQTTFLRFFEEFSYRELGLRCRLHNYICEMGGVEAAPNGGYYIVRGGGIPRINIVGFTERVDWPKVVARLKKAIENPSGIQIDS